jgi:glycosyltransferase involved in cell wall biosynthesis
MSQWDVGVAPFLPLPRFYFSPLKVVEYMAAGICAIASDLGQIRTLLGRGERGVLVEPGNAGALAGAILGLAADRHVAAELGARARAYALSSLTWQKNAERALSALTAREELAI